MKNTKSGEPAPVDDNGAEKMVKHLPKGKEKSSPPAYGELIKELGPTGFFEESIEDYGNACVGGFLGADANIGSHALFEFGNCPLLFKSRMLGGNGFINSENSVADGITIDAAVRTLLLRGNGAFIDAFTDGNGDWVPLFTSDSASLAQTMAHSAETHKHASAVLNDDGLTLHVIRPRIVIDGIDGDKEASISLPCHSMIERLSASVGIVEIKTCDNLQSFPKECMRGSYPFHLAYQALLIEIALNVKVEARFIVIERECPYRTGVFRMGTRTMQMAQARIRLLWEELAVSLHTNTWPTNYEHPRYL